MQLERLIDNGISPNLSDYDARTPLHLAAACGAQKSVEYLLQHGADPCAKDRWKGLPLLDAVKEGHSLVAEIIHQAGGKLYSDEDVAMSAKQLCDAAAVGDVRKLALLKDADVDLDQGNYDDRHALHLAAANGKLLAVSYLLSIGANCNVLDRWSSTPLEDALRNGHTYCAVLLHALGGRPGPSPSPEIQDAFAALDLDKVTEAREALKAMLKKVRPC